MLNAFTPDGEIDYSKVLISYGKLAGALNASVTKGNNCLHFSWTDNTNNNWSLINDQVILLAYDVNNKQVFGMLNGTRRSTGYETLVLPQCQNEITVHTWIAFISDDRQQISMSTYLGKIVY